jgi:cell division protein FtsB
MSERTNERQRERMRWVSEFSFLPSCTSSHVHHFRFLFVHRTVGSVQQSEQQKQESVKKRNFYEAEGVMEKKA